MKLLDAVKLMVQYHKQEWMQHLQSSCIHHILGDAVPCSMIYGMDGYLTLKTVKDKKLIALIFNKSR